MTGFILGCLFMMLIVPLIIRTAATAITIQAYKQIDRDFEELQRTRNTSKPQPKVLTPAESYLKELGVEGIVTKE